MKQTAEQLFAQSIDEIVESHLRDGQVVERLLTPSDVGR